MLILSAFSYVLAISTILPFSLAACTANTTDTPGLQQLLQNGGKGYTLSLCKNQVYSLTGVLNYTAQSQEISTEGYPTDSSRAVLKITGFNITTAVQASATGRDNCKLRNVQIDGNRGNEPIYTAPNANIEFGGQNTGQLIEYVKSYDPRGWSCLHVAEGPFQCRDVTIQNNDIGPCGSESFQQWSDGISLSCADSLVQDNTITDATDGGIVIFGSPGSTIKNNQISVQTRTCLGGINMVDVEPWQPYGNFSGVTVDGNTIQGGFATDYGNSTLGKNNASAVIKIGIAIGPQTWFSDNRYGSNQTFGATIQNNKLSGAFVFGMSIGGARQDTISNNAFVGNVSFIGDYGPNCTQGDKTPNSPVALLLDPSTTTDLTINVPSPSSSVLSMAPGTKGFTNGRVLGMTCFMPPSSDSIAWPYGDGLNSEPLQTNKHSGGAGPGLKRPSMLAATGVLMLWPLLSAIRAI